MVVDSRALAIAPTADLHPSSGTVERWPKSLDKFALTSHQLKKEETRLYIQHTHFKTEHKQTKLDRQTSRMVKILPDGFNVLVSDWH